MRYLVVGLGNIGTKRKEILGDRCVATVDPVNPRADYTSHADCPLDRYDAAILSVPNAEKLGMLEYFLERGVPVLVEKPLIASPDALERLEKLSRTTKAIWYTSYNLRFEPHVMALKRHLEARTLGRLYHVRMFYGNGSAGSINGTWRDDRYGVLADMASHLIDLAGFVFGQFGATFELWDRQRHELIQGPDHCILATADRSVVVECSFLSWRNCWEIEVTGEKGAVSMYGLTKWGGSQLVVEKRQPSGPPLDKWDSVVIPDPTWAADFQHFEERVARGEGSCDNDLWISRVVRAAASAYVE